MPGAGAVKRHNEKRRRTIKLRKECYFMDSEGTWRPRHGFNRKGARRAIDRIYELTGRTYASYECSMCSMYHIRLARRTYQPQPC